MMSIDIPGLGTATTLDAVGTAQNLKGEKMLDKMSAHCAALSVASGDKKYIGGACVLADSDGDKIFSTFDTRDLDKSQPEMNCGTHIIRDSPDAPQPAVNIDAFQAFPQDRREVWTVTGTTGGPNGNRGSDRPIFPGFGRTRPLAFLPPNDPRNSHAGAGGACGRSSAMSRKISWNVCRGIATSAIWKKM